MSQLSLLNRSVCPPEPGFRYVFPEDGYAAVSWTHDAWLADALGHARANNLTEPTLSQMEHQLCQTLPPNWCLYDDPNRPRAGLQMEWSDVLRGTETLSRWLLGGKQSVNPEEAERRALVCANCYLNVHVGGCSWCQKAVIDLTGALKTKYDFALRTCAACKCALKLKVHLPQNILDREDQQLQEIVPAFCWLKKGGTNYRP